MRTYLELWEIETVLEKHLAADHVQQIMQEMEDEAETCLCHAHCSSECLCGAWDEDGE